MIKDYYQGQADFRDRAVSLLEALRIHCNSCNFDRLFVEFAPVVIKNMIIDEHPQNNHTQEILSRHEPDY